MNQQRRLARAHNREYSANLVNGVPKKAAEEPNKGEIAQSPAPETKPITPKSRRR